MHFIEALEPRMLLSDTPTGLTPQQVRHAYGFDQITFQTPSGQTVDGTGAGQTIAIVEAYRTPGIGNILRTFDATFGIPDTDADGRFVLTRAAPQGRPTTSPGWAAETSLDVEWAHAIAPKAHILLVQARSPSTRNLLKAVNYARHQPGVVVVSMSWGGDETSNETKYDPILTTPGAHQGGSGLPGGITFVAAAGDSGAGTSWPGVSPSVVSVGGTTLNVDGNGNYISESAWSGSGGGPSALEPSLTQSPTLAYNADPHTGFSVYDPIPYHGHTGWFTAGGTSAGTPQIAAMIAIADEGRAYQGKGSLDGAGQTLPALFSAPAPAFHDITTGSTGYQATPGYDYATGMGTPVADQLVPDLVNT
jgi:subtilase family serine protease